MQSFKTELDLNNKQKTKCAKHAGVSRHAYNWGLALCQKMREEGEKHPSAIDLHKRLVADVKTANPWYYEVSKCAPQQALRDLDTAYKRFFKGTSKFPKFKKKGVRDSFYLDGSIRISGNRIKLPKIGWVNCHEQLPSATPKNCTISRKADRWFISFKLDVTPEPTVKTLGAVGVDIGIKTLATLSSGEQVDNPKAYRLNKERLGRLQRKMARQLEGGKNRAKTKLKLAKLHARISNIRTDSTHKLTSFLAKNHSEIVIEDLNVSGMLKNHKLAGAIADAGFYEFKRQLLYKAEWYGSTVTIVDRFFPSSKLCSCCGNKKATLSLSDRVYNCDSCGLSLDRDLNAAINLKNAASSAVSACGDCVSPELALASVCETGTKRQPALVGLDRS